MAKIKAKTLSFESSTSPDVVGYRLYVAAEGEELTYDSEVLDLGMETTVNLGAVPALASKDGIFTIGITAVDDGGNESDMTTMGGVPLDFQAPNPPGAVSLL